MLQRGGICAWGESEGLVGINMWRWTSSGEFRFHLKALIRWLAAVPLALAILRVSGQLAVMGAVNLGRVDTRSNLVADYGPWPYLVVHPVLPEIVEEAALDKQQYPELYEAPGSPVAAGPPWNTPSLTPAVTATGSSPAPGLGQTPDRTPSATQAPSTIGPPTLSPSPTASQAASPTGTTASPATAPPTSTPAPTSTRSATPAPTQTATATSSGLPPCSKVYSSDFRLFCTPYQCMEMHVINDGPTPVTLTRITIEWSNDKPGVQYMDYIAWLGHEIFWGPDYDSPTVVDPIRSVWPGGEVPSLEGGGSLGVMDAAFGWTPPDGITGDFRVTMVFDGACTVSDMVSN